MSRSNSLSDDYDDTILTLRFANLMVPIWRSRNAAQTKKNIYVGVSGEKKRQSISSDRRLLIPRVKGEKRERKRERERSIDEVKRRKYDERGNRRNAGKSLEDWESEFYRWKEELAAHYLNHPQEKAVPRTGATLSRRISKSNVIIKLSPPLGRFR